MLRPSPLPRLLLFLAFFLAAGLSAPMQEVIEPSLASLTSPKEKTIKMDQTSHPAMKPVC